MCLNEELESILANRHLVLLDAQEPIICLLGNLNVTKPSII